MLEPDAPELKESSHSLKRLTSLTGQSGKNQTKNIYNTPLHTLITTYT